LPIQNRFTISSLVQMTLPALFPEFPKGLQANVLSDGFRLSVGIDLAQISQIQSSWDQFGAAYLQRIFTPSEQAYALSAPAVCAERLAARFAAKEAALKALGLANEGVSWLELEVVRAPSGACDLVLHGSAAALSHQKGLHQLALSLSHDGDFAAAIVVAITRPQN
jgi:holo-[acyl-carrier protein] synthase